MASKECVGTGDCVTGTGTGAGAIGQGDPTQLGTTFIVKRYDRSLNYSRRSRFSMPTDRVSFGIRMILSMTQDPIAMPFFCRSRVPAHPVEGVFSQASAHTAQSTTTLQGTSRLSALRWNMSASMGNRPPATLLHVWRSVRRSRPTFSGAQLHALVKVSSRPRIGGSRLSDRSNADRSRHAQPIFNRLHQS